MKKIFIIFSPEITIKSYKVRFFLIKQLIQNILDVIKPIYKNIYINSFWDRLEIINNSSFKEKDIIINLQYIPGINKILFVKEFIFEGFKKLWIQIKSCWEYNKIINKSFAIKVNKTSNYHFSSKNLECYLGYKLKKLIPNSKVILSKPDILLEIRLLSNNKWIFIKEKIIGIDGFPITNNNSVLSLISGGFDSTLASFLMLKKGCKVYYCYFNFYPFSNELPIQKIIYELSNKIGLRNNINFIIVDIVKIANLILNIIRPNYIIIILKRLMIKISTHLAQLYNINSLITGESLGQVSSQTLHNIHIIDEVTKLTILRPLITYNKQEIIDVLKILNLYELCNGIPEYCGLFGKRVTTAAFLHKVYEEEKKIPSYLLIDAIENRRSILINLDSYNNIDYIKNSIPPVILDLNSVNRDCLILDIRPKIQQLKRPLNIKNFNIISIPYIYLPDIINRLDKSIIWLLFCENNHISYLQAIAMYNKGYTNVRVLNYKLKTI